MYWLRELESYVNSCFFYHNKTISPTNKIFGSQGISRIGFLGVMDGYNLSSFEGKSKNK
jgi:hypothetical protein